MLFGHAANSAACFATIIEVVNVCRLVAQIYCVGRASRSLREVPITSYIIPQSKV